MNILFLFQFHLFFGDTSQAYIGIPSHSFCTHHFCTNPLNSLRCASFQGFLSLPLLFLIFSNVCLLLFCFPLMVFIYPSTSFGSFAIFGILIFYPSILSCSILDFPYKGHISFKFFNALGNIW